MIKLQTEFVSGNGGFSQNPLTYKQLKRTETVALYERSFEGKVKDYEVFRIKVLPKGAQIFNAVNPDDLEQYPGASSFGKWAWSISSLKRAEEVFEELTRTPEQIAADEAAEETEEQAEIATTSDAPKRRGRVAGPKPTIIIPAIEFTVGELAEQNHVQYPIAFLFVQEAVKGGSVKFIREERRHAKGKASKIYAKAESN